MLLFSASIYLGFAGWSCSDFVVWFFFSLLIRFFLLLLLLICSFLSKCKWINVFHFLFGYKVQTVQFYWISIFFLVSIFLSVSVCVSEWLHLPRTLLIIQNQRIKIWTHLESDEYYGNPRDQHIRSANDWCDMHNKRTFSKAIHINPCVHDQ